MNRVKRIACFLIVLSGSLAAQNECLGDLLLGTGYVSVPDSASLTPATGFTLEAWVYFGNAANEDRRIAFKDPDVPGGGYQLFVDQNGRPFGFVRTNLGTWGGPPAAFNTIPHFVWSHLAMTYDNTILRLFINGTQVGSYTNPTSTLVDLDGPLLIGSGPGGGSLWPGRLDEVRLWSTARTSAQLQSRMNYQIGYEPGLVSVWRFNGSYEDVIGGNDGGPVGSVPFTSAAPALVPVLTAPLIASIGTPIVYHVATPTAGASVPYVFDVSLTGSEPGVVFGGFPIPLNPPFLNSSFGGPFFQGFVGSTNLLGQATPTLTIPLIPSIAGVTLSGCFVTLNAGGTALTTVGTPVTTMIANPPPSIGGVTPPAGPHTGGTTVTITGMNFLPGATVTFGAQQAGNVTVLDSSTVQCTSPASGLGAVTVTVQNPDGLSASAPGAFTYQLGLELFFVYPALPVSGPITIYGAGFQSGLTLELGGMPITPTAVTPNQVTFLAPLGAPCSTMLTIVNPGGQTASLGFNHAPEIQSQSPPSGPAAGGTMLSLGGLWFYPGTTVTIGGASALIQSLSLGSIVALTPPGQSGPAPLIVTSPSGCTTATVFVYE